MPFTTDYLFFNSSSHLCTLRKHLKIKYKQHNKQRKLLFNLFPRTNTNINPPYTLHLTPYTRKKHPRACVCAIVKSVRWYFGTPLPLRGGFPPNVTFAQCRPYAKMGAFLPVLRTPFRVRLYAACMRAYAAYFRPQNIEFYSIRQKKHPIICVCAIFVVNLQPI